MLPGSMVTGMRLLRSVSRMTHEVCSPDRKMRPIMPRVSITAWPGFTPSALPASRIMVWSKGRLARPITCAITEDSAGSGTACRSS